MGTELVAVLCAVPEDTPRVLSGERPDRLPAGPLRSDHRSLQTGLRAWVEQQTGRRLGYVEQLYTFADVHRGGSQRVISVSYLGLTRIEAAQPGWRSWYEHFPWEDRRDGDGEALRVLRERLGRWVAQAPPAQRSRRALRSAVTFGAGTGGQPWAPELVLQRYELLYEAGLVPEAGERFVGLPDHLVGAPMDADHRRILATGIARLRAKIQYRPVVFELVPEQFTLGRLQAVVEAIAGQPVHKQNFRRLVTRQELVEEVPGAETATGGRPARLFRFRRAVLDERHVAGTTLPSVRSH